MGVNKLLYVMRWSKGEKSVVSLSTNNVISRCYADFVIAMYSAEKVSKLLSQKNLDPENSPIYLYLKLCSDFVSLSLDCLSVWTSIQRLFDRGGDRGKGC